jgi:hypothetical protein
VSNGIVQAIDTSDARVEQWLHLDDFAAGIFDGSYISTAEPIISAPFGAAQPTGTFCCASLPSGGLGPLPGISQVFGYSTPFPGTTDILFITGFINNPGLVNLDDELIILLEGDDGTHHYNLAYSYVPQTTTANAITNATETNASFAGYVGSPYPAWTRISSQPVIGDEGYIVPTPVLVWPATALTDSHTDQGHLWCYPPVGSPTEFSAQDLVNTETSGNTGQVICYDSRVIVLSGVAYSWPVSGGVATNENINYTDPPESEDYGDQQTLLVAEEPWGYGAWGSISVGELMLVKKRAGGVMVIGDIDAPSSVIYLAGIQPTGDIVGSAGVNQIGLIYCSEGRGAWVWNGGNTSQKISAQLQDNFFDCSSTVIPSNNYGFYVESWQDWILVSNNWLYNPDTGGWWRIYPPTGAGNEFVTGQTFFWWSKARLGYQRYAAPLAIGNGAESSFGLDWFSRFDSTVPASAWSWTSLPMHLVPTADRVVDVRQIVLRLSSPDGTTTAHASIVINNDFEASTIGTIGPDPTTFRFNVGIGALGLEDVVVEIFTWNTDGSAPILHSMDIGFNVRASINTDN